MNYEELFKRASKLNVYEWIDIINNTQSYNVQTCDISVNINLTDNEICVDTLYKQADNGEQIYLKLYIHLDGILFNVAFNNQHEIVIELYKYLKIEEDE